MNRSSNCGFLFLISNSISGHSSAEVLAGPSFTNLNRLMESPARLWLEIFSANKKSVLRAIDDLQVELSTMHAAICQDDRAALASRFQTAARVKTQDMSVITSSKV
jgi:prephenate dehydrogenase